MKKRPLILAALACAVLATAYYQANKALDSMKHRAVCEWLSDDLAKTKAQIVEDEIQKCSNLLTALGGPQAAAQCPSLVEQQVLPGLSKYISDKLSSAGCQ